MISKTDSRDRFNRPSILITKQLINIDIGMVKFIYKLTKIKENNAVILEDFLINFYLNFTIPKYIVVQAECVNNKLKITHECPAVPISFCGGLIFLLPFQSVIVKA
ncbi:hypothetical protein BpHYR1_004185 [Brachionus plicatilis]|uniref:Uncharacterized protein n=1 Tax=Brachionus plicatilis TaxID=10195 RepID=A0A3M7PZI3_BRAPC|nr:hypothetical protein BpHYR1_004185 [Brachionus plicatilis]